MEKIELFTIPFVHGNIFYGLLPSMMESYRAQVETRGVVHNNLLLFLFRRPWRSHRRILCLHWSTALYGSRYSLKSLAFLVGNFFALAVLKSFFKFKVVWVMHNNHAHDYEHQWIDTLGRFLLRLHADVLVAQQEKTLLRLRSAYPRKRIIHIPHCNYTALYASPKESKVAARKRFGFAPDDVILLSLGAMRPYKKIECFIDALRTLDSAHSRLRLWITGKSDPQYLSALAQRAEGLAGVRFNDGFVPDNDLPAYAACADYAIFYFDESELTSGSVLLSLSLGLPVIARDIAGAEIIRSPENGYVFKDFPRLVEILKLLSGTTPPSRERVLQSLIGTDFLEIERKYFELYGSLV
jgi:glycosyltransferase involved in cell wall biosynthesis